MQPLEQIVLSLHVFTGLASLVLFWVPVCAQKGGSLHRRAGRYYVRCMWVVAITALLLSLQNWLQGNELLGVFLGFLSLLTAKPLWLGTAILKNKMSPSFVFRLSGMILNGLMALAGGLLILYGLSMSDQSAAILLYVFGVIGLSSIFDLVSMIKQDSRSRNWTRLHIVSMGTSGIAAHTAFLTFGATRLIIEWLHGYWVLVLWLAPTLLGAIAIHLSVRRLKSLGFG